MQWTAELEDHACYAYESYCFVSKVFKERGAEYPLAWTALDERYREELRDYIRVQLKIPRPRPQPVPEPNMQLFPTATPALLGVRDACHQAAIVVTCNVPVWPGDSLVFASVAEHQTRRVGLGEARHGLVDPWRQERIPAGEPFWFHLAPEVIRSPLWHQFRLTLEGPQQPVQAVPPEPEPEPKPKAWVPEVAAPFTGPLKSLGQYSMSSGVLPRAVATAPVVVSKVVPPAVAVAEEDEGEGPTCHSNC